MSKLTSGERAHLPAKDFAGPNRSFPVENKSHARAAISGATRAEHAGHISPSQEAHIKSEARAVLGDAMVHRESHSPMTKADK
jgi:hypothetical protein